MYLRTIRRRNQDGSVVGYLQLAHNLRPEFVKPRETTASRELLTRRD